MRILVPILLIGAAIGIFFGYTNGSYHAVLDKRVQYDQIQKAQQNAYELDKQKSKILAMRGNISDNDILQLSKMLPDGVDNLGLIIEMKNIAKKDNMGLPQNPQINQGAVAKSGTKGIDSAKYGALSMTFSVTGTYDQFLVFLKDLETYVRIVDVVGLSFSAAGKADQYDYSLTIQTYWLK